MRNGRRRLFENLVTAVGTRRNIQVNRSPVHRCARDGGWGPNGDLVAFGGGGGGGVHKTPTEVVARAAGRQ